jgi:hypothetical protein
MLLKPVGWFTRAAAAIVSCLLLVGCSGQPQVSTQPSVSAAASGLVTPDIAQQLAAVPPADDTAATEAFARRIDQGFIDQTREAGGVADALGVQAGPTFAQLDEARQKLLQKVLDKEIAIESKRLEVASVAGTPVRRPPLSIGRFAASFIAQVSPSGSAQTALDFESKVGGPIPDETGGGEYEEGQVKATFIKTRSLAGGHMDIEGTMTIRLTLPDPPGGTIEERYHAKLELSVCPDEDGSVPLTLELTFESGLKGGAAGEVAGETALRSAATGTADDEAVLKSVDVNSNVSERSTGRAAGEQAKGAYTEIGITASYGPTTSGAGLSPTQYAGTLIHRSSRATDDSIEALLVVGILADAFLTLDGMQEAEQLWRNGHCVEITVSDPPNAYKPGVEVDSTHPIAAEVRHRHESATVEALIEASMKSGQVSVEPSGVRRPSPATFTYTAPSKTEDGGTVLLRTVSRRGIAQKDVSFNTFLEYRIRITFTYSASLVLIPGATGGGSGTDVFEGVVLPKTSTAGASHSYEGEIVASSTGSSEQTVAGVTCTQAWTGTQPMDVVAAPHGSGSLDQTFRAAGGPTFSRHQSGGPGDICSFDDIRASDGRVILPFGTTIIGEQIPLTIDAPPAPGQTATQRLRSDGDLGGMQIRGEWLIEWLAPEN